MIPEYVEAVDVLLAHLATDPITGTITGTITGNSAEAIAIASLPDRVRGYEGLKLERAEAYREELAIRLEHFSR